MRITESGMRSMVREEIRRHISESPIGPAALWSILGGCSPENQIIPIGDETSGTDTGYDTGGEAGELSWDDLPDCTQKIEWLPHPSDSRWNEGGVPIEDFYIVGRSETLPADIEGDYLFSILDTEEEYLLCQWQYVPDSCDYWSSEYNVWAQESEGNLSSMETVYAAYDESPLLRVTCNFPVEHRDGEMFLRLPAMGTGGSISKHSLDDECVQEYLSAIGDVIDTGSTTI